MCCSPYPVPDELYAYVQRYIFFFWGGDVVGALGGAIYPGRNPGRDGPASYPNSRIAHLYTRYLIDIFLPGLTTFGCQFHVKSSRLLLLFDGWTTTYVATTSSV